MPPKWSPKPKIIVIEVCPRSADTGYHASFRGETIQKTRGTAWDEGKTVEGAILGLIASDSEKLGLTKDQYLGAVNSLSISGSMTPRASLQILVRRLLDNRITLDIRFLPTEAR